jgi:hypothetical protein
MQYMRNTKVENALIQAIRAALRGDLISKNPYIPMFRSLQGTNLQTEMVTNFEKIAKLFVQNPLEPEGNWGLTCVKGRQNLVGLPHVLEYIDVEKISILRKSILDFLPDMKNEVKGVKVSKLWKRLKGIQGFLFPPFRS